MAKKKIYRRKPASPKPEPAPKKPFPWKKALLLGLSFLLFFTFYQVGLYHEWLWILHAYAISTGLVAIAYGVWNRGVFRVPKPEELPATWNKAEKEAFIEGIAARRKQSSLLLYILIPLILTLVCDLSYLFVTNTLGVKL